MILKNRIQIPGDQVRVFDSFTNTSEALSQDAELLNVWNISGNAWEIGSQVGYHFLHDRVCLEVIETLIDVDRPGRIASSLEFKRFLPLPRDMLRQHEFAIVGDELDKMFALSYGTNGATGLVLAEFEKLPSNQTMITQTLDLQIGGLNGILTRLQSFRRRSPIAAKLEAFRERFEEHHGVASGPVDLSPTRESLTSAHQ